MKICSKTVILIIVKQVKVLVSEVKRDDTLKFHMLSSLDFKLRLNKSRTLINKRLDYEALILMLIYMIYKN